MAALLADLRAEGRRRQVVDGLIRDWAARTDIGSLERLSNRADFIEETAVLGADNDFHIGKGGHLRQGTSLADFQREVMSLRDRIDPDNPVPVRDGTRLVIPVVVEGRVREDGLNLGSIIETLNRHGATTLMVQKFLPQISEGDKRVLVIGGVPVPWCLARIPQGGEVRGNLAAGGKGVARPLTERDREIAATLGPILAARGLLLVGLDVIGDCLTEINVTSPTCFQEITQQSGFDVAAMFIDALEQALA